MFAQFFGAYLLNNKMVSAEDLTKAMDEKKNTRMRLGVLAINAGLMTAEQVEKVNESQQSVDKRFGDLAVDMGFVTNEQVEQLLSQQPMDYLILGQTLVNNGVLTNSQFEKALADYKAAAEISDDNIAKNQSEQLSKLINEFYHFDTAENARLYSDYITLLLKNVIRFIGDDFTPLKASLIRNFDAKYLVSQTVSGGYELSTYIAADKEEYLSFAKRFAKDQFDNVNEFIDETVGEFLNVNNGLFLVNESSKNGVELSMQPQVYVKNQTIDFNRPAFYIPVAFSFGEIAFIISAK